MENMNLNINTSNYESSYLNLASKVEIKAELETSKISLDPENIQNDEVLISKEGKEKQLKESTTAALRKIMGEDKVDESSKAEAFSLEEMIAELQEKIAELTREVSKLRASGDESSLEKAKILDVELAGLNAQLIELISQKLESDKSTA